MFTARLKVAAKEAHGALKAQLVELYSKLQGGQLSDEQRTQLQRAIDEVKTKLEAQTRILRA
jgi:ribosome-associated translation inhibitor RaiA